MIIGENHSFDNVFATYQPPGHQHIRNLLSERIINKNGSPGPNYAKATQRFPAALPDGPFQITKYVPYFDSHVQYSKFGQCELFGAYVGDPPGPASSTTPTPTTSRS